MSEGANAEGGGCECTDEDEGGRETADEGESESARESMTKRTKPRQAKKAKGAF